GSFAVPTDFRPTTGRKPGRYPLIFAAREGAQGMRFIDRFTRDDVSAKVWWPFTMLLIVLLVLTFPGEHRAIDSRHRDTAAADASLSTRVIAPLVTSAPAGTIAGSLSDQLTEEVRDEILVNDARITAVRIWSA